MGVGSQSGEDSPQMAPGGLGEVMAGRVGGPNICMWINQEEQLGSKTDHATQSSTVGK